MATTTFSASKMDSMNVPVCAHHVLAFGRLGPYPMTALEALAYRQRELFD